MRGRIGIEVAAQGARGCPAGARAAPILTQFHLDSQSASETHASRLGGLRSSSFSAPGTPKVFCRCRGQGILDRGGTSVVPGNRPPSQGWRRLRFRSHEFRTGALGKRRRTAAPSPMNEIRSPDAPRARLLPHAWMDKRATAPLANAAHLAWRYWTQPWLSSQVAACGIGRLGTRCPRGA